MRIECLSPREQLGLEQLLEVLLYDNVILRLHLTEMALQVEIRLIGPPLLFCYCNCLIMALVTTLFASATFVVCGSSGGQRLPISLISSG